MDELLQPLMSPGDAAAIQPYVKQATNLFLLSQETEIKLAFRAQPDQLRSPYTLHWFISLEGITTGASLELVAIGKLYNQEFVVECRRVITRLVLQHCRNITALSLCASIRDMEYIRADPDDESQQPAVENRRQDFEGMFYSVCDMEEFMRHYHLFQSSNELAPIRKLSLQGVSFQEEYSKNLRNLTHLKVQLSNAFDDTVIHGLLERSQDLQEIVAVCQEGFLWDASLELEHELDVMMVNLPHDNPRLRKIHVQGETIKFRSSTYGGCNYVTQALKGLPELEEFLVRAPRLGEEFAEAVVRALPQTSIRRLTLGGVPLPPSSVSDEEAEGSFEILCNYISQPRCPIEFMEIDTSQWNDQQKKMWFDLLATGCGISVTRRSLQHTSRAMAYLWHMKKLHPLWTEVSDTTQLGLIPHILAAVQRQRHRGTWFEQSSLQNRSTDRHPASGSTCAGRSRLASSMVFSLLRENADLLCNNIPWASSWKGTPMTDSRSVSSSTGDGGDGRCSSSGSDSWRRRTKKLKVTEST